MNNIVFYFVFLSFIGWIIESSFVSIKQRNFTNRGFLFLPFIPSYGLIGTLIIILNYQLNLGYISWFIITMFFASLFEYLCSFLVEKIFKIHLWNYSHMKYNLHGRICLLNAILFGFLGSTLIYSLPLINQIYVYIPSFLIYILLILIILDYLTNIRVVLHAKKEYIRELGSREMKFVLHNNHVPVNFTLLFKTKNKLHEHLKKNLVKTVNKK